MTLNTPLETPAVLIHRPQLLANIARMAQLAQDKGIKLRPHVKTHKIPEIAQLQLDAGAQGITCATITEAEVFGRAGFPDIFIAYPLHLSDAAKARLNAFPGKVSIGVDSVEAAKNLAGVRADIKALIEVDCGHRRSGVLPDSPELAQIFRALGDRYAGVFTFPGHSYGPGNAASAAAAETTALQACVEKLGGGLSSGGSSPSAALSSGIDEMRPGVYVFNDAQQLDSGACTPEDIALTVLSTVVSRNVAERRVIMDAGSKILSTDKPAWIAGHGFVQGHPQLRISALSEHHATLFWPAELELPEIGAQLELVPNHACNVINLVDEVHVAGENLSWQVAARGKNS
ncbi:alanine racemase [Corynebacterium callunae]|uniref:alanine racemase n=1 Tax=Corynebacterium callunae TaxID=1721 RepID=UPI0039822A3C